MAATPPRHAGAGPDRREGSGQFLIEQARLVATDVKGVVIPGSGHWLMDEAPDKVIPALVAFLNESGRERPRGCATDRPAEIEALAPDERGGGNFGGLRHSDPHPDR